MTSSKKITNEKTPLLDVKMNSPNLFLLGASFEIHACLPEQIQMPT